MPAVTVVDGRDVLHPVLDGDRVTGARDPASRRRVVVTLAADVVVDATGRGPASPCG